MTTRSAIVLGLAGVVSVGMACATLLYITNAKARERVTIDAPYRYELKDFGQGSLIGVALLDKETGRIWFLRRITDEKSKGIHESFEETSVEDLWPKEDEDEVSEVLKRFGAQRKEGGRPAPQAPAKNPIH